jgi:hypothetical protein
LIDDPASFGYWDVVHQDWARNRVEFDWETISSLVVFLVAGLGAGLTRSVPKERHVAFAILSSMAFSLLYVELNALDNMLMPNPDLYRSSDHDLMAFTFGALFRTLALGAFNSIPTFVGLLTGKAIANRRLPGKDDSTH